MRGNLSPLRLWFSAFLGVSTLRRASWGPPPTVSESVAWGRGLRMCTVTSPRGVLTLRTTAPAGRTTRVGESEASDLGQRAPGALAAAPRGSQVQLLFQPQDPGQILP